MSVADQGDRFTGCLVGLAVGDAIGRPTERSGDPSGDENWPLEAQQWIDDCLSCLADGGLPVDTSSPSGRFGQVTDDTQMAVELARSLLGDRKAVDAFDGLRFSKQLLARRNCVLGIGHTTQEALQRLQDDPGSWQTTGGMGASNGAAMRVAPLGLVRSHSAAWASEHVGTLSSKCGCKARRRTGMRRPLLRQWWWLSG